METERGREAGSPSLHNRQMINADTVSQRVKVHVNVRELVRTYTLCVKLKGFIVNGGVDSSNNSSD